MYQEFFFYCVPLVDGIVELVDFSLLKNKLKSTKNFSFIVFIF